MDSQGQFDNFTSNKESASIFSISAFMSSVQIYNLKNNLEKTDLEYLSVFADYKNVTEKLFQKSMRFEVSEFKNFLFTNRTPLNLIAAP